MTGYIRVTLHKEHWWQKVKHDYKSVVVVAERTITIENSVYTYFLVKDAEDNYFEIDVNDFFKEI